MRHCQEQGTTATATLTSFIQLYLDGKLDNLDADMLGDCLLMNISNTYRHTWINT